MTSPSANPEPRPLLVIRPPRRWMPINWRELWQFRDLVARLARRDLTLRYRQTALGVAWVVLQPLLAAATLAFVFGRVAGLSSGGVPYFAFAFAGMLAWNAFSGIVVRMSNSLVGQPALVSKIFFPRLVLPLSGIGAILVDFGVSLAMMAVIWPVAGVAPGWSLLTLPLWLAAVLLLASGIGLLAAALMVSYRDVQYVLPLAIQLLLFISPVGYALSHVPHSARFLYELNPLAGILEGFRWAVLDIGHLGTFPTIWAFGCSLAVFMFGALVFARMDREFADVI